MSTLFNVIFAWKCSSTHHKLAMDALNQLQSSQAERWRDLCLANVGKYLEGSKAPDNKFKDFRNHVLHVRENHWGGAVGSTTKWYAESVKALKEKRWADAVYAAGVLSHYYTDPIQPLHTAQSEAEGVIHQACEWSIACAYRELTMLLESELNGWPDVPVPSGADWLGQMVTAGAELANPHYEACLDHYDLAKGTKNPPQGLDQDLRVRFARLIGHAVVGYARIMDRALEEAQASLPATNLTLQSVIATLSIPINWVTKKLTDAKERKLVEAIYREYQQTGKVVESLSEDDSRLRELHATEVRKIPLADLDAEPAGAVGTAYGTTTEQPSTARKPAVLAPMAGTVSSIHATKTPAIDVKKVQQSASSAWTGTSSSTPKPSTGLSEKFTFALPDLKTKPSPAKAGTTAPSSAESDRFFLKEGMDVVQAPSIGPKTAKRLGEHGIKTVHDLLNASADELASRIADRQIKKDLIVEWQVQARLCCDVPNLRGHDAQFLSAVGIKNRNELAQANAQALLERVDEFVETPAGQRILRGGTRPDRAEVSDWIRWATINTTANAA